MITVYTNKQCSQCEQTKRYLTKHGVDFSIRPVAALTGLVQDLGLMTAPVVVMELADGFFAVNSGHSEKILDKMIIVSKQKENETYDF